MNSWINSLRERIREDERGLTLFEVVLTITILLALIGLTASAVSIAQGAQASTMLTSKNILTSNGIIEKLNRDLDSSVDIQAVGAQALELAKKDGTCVRWEITEGEETKSIKRYSAAGPITGSASIATYTEDLKPTGSSLFSKTAKRVSLTMDYKGADKPVEGSYLLKIAPDGKTGRTTCGWL